MSIESVLEHYFQQAMLDIGLPSECKPAISLSKKAQFGDYQANGAMAAGKRVGEAPRAIAEKICAQLANQEFAEKLEVAGPGFINIHLSTQWLSERLNHYELNAPSLSDAEKQTVVADYSSPNLAKEMHVGHLRSTIIGDAVVLCLEYLGHKVIRQNHVGDWGTQFGMLIAELELSMQSGTAAELALEDLEKFYKQAKAHFDDDAIFADTAREYVVKLQSGDQEVLALWEQFRAVSLQHSEEIYRLLNVSLKPEHIYGESAYNEDLPRLVEALEQQALLAEDDGAKVVFLQEMANKKGEPFGVIVQKRDGGYLYATTDLAAVRYRIGVLHAGRIMIFTDARQSDHLQQVFLVSRKAQFASDDVRLEHHKFGTMLGPDGKPFKTREGKTVKLADLLRESVERALTIVTSKNPSMDEEHAQSIAQKVGIAAVKYADLSKTRTNDYVFNWDAMLSLEGNTGPYMQYAYARTQSILRNATEKNVVQGPIIIEQTVEKDLAIKLLQFNRIVQDVAVEAYPHLLCNYLYELAKLFSSFFDQCPILKDDVDVATEIRSSRLSINAKVGQTLNQGLSLLGIEVMDKM